MVWTFSKIVRGYHKLPVRVSFDNEMYKTFIFEHIGIPIFLGLLVGHELVTKSKRVTAEEANFFTGEDTIDREEDKVLERQETEHELRTANSRR